MDTVTKMGSHLMLDFVGITSTDLNDFHSLDKLFRSCIETCGATIETMNYKQFVPQGLSILYLLSESHFSIHTWPESLSCAIDFYHCGETAFERLSKAEEILCDAFGWEYCTGSILIERGGSRQALVNCSSSHSTLYKDLKRISREKSESNEFRIYQNTNSEYLLYLNGLIRYKEVSLEKSRNVDDFVQNYRKHFVTKVDQDYENVLVLGGGEMSTAVNLLLNFSEIWKATLVEGDAKLLKTYQKFPILSEKADGLVKEGKLELVVESPEKFVNEKIKEDKKFDGIVLDIFDGDSCENLEFYRNIFELLKPGACIVQNVKGERFKGNWEKLMKDIGFKAISFFNNQCFETSAQPLASARKT